MNPLAVLQERQFVADPLHVAHKGSQLEQLSPVATMNYPAGQPHLLLAKVIPAPDLHAVQLVAEPEQVEQGQRAGCAQEVLHHGHGNSPGCRCDVCFFLSTPNPSSEGAARIAFNLGQDRCKGSRGICACRNGNFTSRSKTVRLARESGGFP